MARVPMQHAAAILLALVLPQHASGAPPARDRGEDRKAAVERIQSEERLGEKLKGARTQTEQTDICLGMLWDPSLKDEPLRAAARRRLDDTAPRVLAARLVERLETASPPVQLQIIRMLDAVYPKLGGVNSLIDEAVVDSLRSSDRKVVEASIDLAVHNALNAAYLPLREIAVRRGDPLRPRAILAIAQLADPRGLPFLIGVLNEGTGRLSRDEIYANIGRMGRPAAEFLRSKLQDGDPAERRRALLALLPVATADDLDALEAYAAGGRLRGEDRAAYDQAMARIRRGP